MHILSFNENVQQGKSILRKLGKPDSDPNFTEIRKILSGMDGYVGFFTDLFYNKNQSMQSLYELANLIKNEKSLVDQLPIPIIKYESFEKIIDDIEKVRLESNAKKMYNEFPSLQKSLINISNKSMINLLDLLYKRPDKKIFLKKISSFKDKNSLVDWIKVFLKSDSSQNFKPIIDRINSVKADIVYSSIEDQIIIARVKTYSQVSDLGSNTSWCIARSESTFRSYVQNDDLAYQYIIYLLDKNGDDPLRKIGVTFNVMSGPTTYQTAHDILDRHVDYNKLKSILTEYNYDIKKLQIDKNNIKYPDNIPVRNLLKIGFSKEEILSTRKKYSSDDVSIFTKEEIDEYNLLDKSEVSGQIFAKYSEKEVIEKDLLDRVTELTLSQLKNLGSDFLNENKDKILSKLTNYSYRGYGSRNITEKEIFEKIISVKNVKSMYDIRVNGSDGRYSLDNTIISIKYHKVGPNTFPLLDKVKTHKRSDGSTYTTVEKSGIARAFDSVYLSDFPNIYKLLISLGYSFGDNDQEKRQNVLAFFGNIFSFSRFSTRVEFYIKLIEMKFDFKKELLEYAESKDSGLISNLSELTAIFGKKDLQNVIKKNFVITFLSDILLAGKYYDIRRSTNVPQLSELEFYDKYNNYIQTLDKLDFSYRPYSYYDSDKYYLGLILIYFKLNKLNELKLDFPIRNSSYLLSSITSLICDSREIYHNDIPKFPIPSMEDRRKLYSWLYNGYATQIIYADKKADNISDSEIYNTVSDYELQVCYYLFDKESWVDYLDRVSKISKNYIYTGSRGKEHTMTARARLLKPILSYFFSKNDTDSILDIYTKMSKWKMTISERKYTLDTIYNYSSSRFMSDHEPIIKFIASLFDATYRGNRPSYHSGNNYEKFELLPKIGKKSKNESFIKNWNEYVYQNRL